MEGAAPETGCPNENGCAAAPADGVASFCESRGEATTKLGRDGGLFSLEAALLSVVDAAGVVKKFEDAVGFWVITSTGTFEGSPFALVSCTLLASPDVRGLKADTASDFCVSVPVSGAGPSAIDDLPKEKGKDGRGGSFAPAVSCSIGLVWDKNESTCNSPQK
jgi:hypothetical protein